MREQNSITDLIAEARRGDTAAVDQILNLAYDDLYALASARLRAGGRDSLLNTAALMQESYLRFSQTGALKAEDRLHFEDYASRVIPSVVGDLLEVGEAANEENVK